MAQLTTSTTPIVALDVPDAATAQRLVERLGDRCDFYKVGLELFSADGPAIVSWLRASGKRVFVDLKLHDIPNTVRSAARAVARQGASLLTVHASGGGEMIGAAVAGAAEGSAAGAMRGGGLSGAMPGDETCGILAVTILTSLDGAAVGAAWGRPAVDVPAEVVRLSGVAQAAGARGVVCSGHEAALVRGACGAGFGLLIPGIRLAGGDAHDQRRVMTPEQAAVAGADWIILGRAVTGAADPVAAMDLVYESLGRNPVGGAK